jgi:hypothetical protein
MKKIAFLLLTVTNICFAQELAAPNLLAEMLKGAETNIKKFCGADKILEFTRSPEAHDTYISYTSEGRRRTIFAPKLTGLAACESSNGVTLIQWTAHSERNLGGELKLSGVTKSFFISKKLSSLRN